MSDAPSSLVNFATGAIAKPDIAKSMLSYIDSGKELAIEFASERLIRNDYVPKKSFCDTMSRSGVKTMKDMQVSVTVKNRNVATDNEVTYMRLMAINAKKKLPLERVMSFENSTVPPLSIFHDNGSMVNRSWALQLQVMAHPQGLNRMLAHILLEHCMAK